MSFLHELNPVQRDAVRAVNGPVMIIAGAGSGKTRVLTYRTAYLLERGVRPESVLALTFTNKAAGEMKERITGLVGDAGRSLWMGTFHSVFARILRHECEALGYTRNFTIYDSDDSQAVIREIMQRLNISAQQFSPAGIRARISTAKNQMVAPAAYKSTSFDPMAERTALVYDDYVRVLKRNNAMDFDDLILKPLELFDKHPAVLERYQFRFRYILVDEYQDTNRVQYRLIKQMAAQHRNICVVGDDAQSIYAFRGADIRNILEFEQDYPECQVFRLEQNYRSTGTILSAADSVIKHNVNQIAKTLWTDNEQGEPITLNICDDDRDEGLRVVRALQEETHLRKLDLKDFAVLYRTNAQSRTIEDTLRRAGIPYHIVGGVAFYKRKEIKDVLAYLQVVANPLDEESLLRIINTPSRGIGDTTVERLRARAAAERIPLIQALPQAGSGDGVAERTARAVRQFSTMMQKYIRLQETISVSELARTIVDEIGVLHAFKEENTQDSLARRENVLELVSALSEFNTLRPEARLEDFLEEVSLVSDVDVTDFGRNAVTLMTLHAAKGLEFPVVFITGLEEGLFPLGTSMEEPGELEEERRLLYVGITRAMKKLYLSCAGMRFRYGEQTYSVRSRFLDEIDPSLMVTPETVRRAATPYRRNASPGRPPTPRTRPGDGVDHYFADSVPKYEDESQEAMHARVGMSVVHESFGRGRILAIEGRGETARAVVDFESVGRKNLMLKFAHLRSA